MTCPRNWLKRTFSTEKAGAADPTLGSRDRLWHADKLRQHSTAASHRRTQGKRSTRL
ncbi:MAG: hypothetical protein ACJ713_18545 [Candidatus Sulfotelmatobacter sp.]